MRVSVIGRLVRVAALLAALAAVADAPAAVAQTPTPPTLPEVVDNAKAWIMGILAALSTLVLVIGGARYVIAGGDPGEIERAKVAIKGALVGYALAALAPVLVKILRGVVGV